jgi:predicted PurR-regulated permease PerM
MIEPPRAERRTRRVDIHVHLPTATLLKVLAAALIAWSVLRLWPEVVFLTISLLLAVALEPLVTWMSERGVSRGVAVMMLAAILLSIIGVVVGVVFPPLAQQIADLVSNFSGLRERVEQRLPADNAVLRTVVDQIFRLPSSPEFMAEVNKPLIWGRAAVSGIMTTFLVLIATLYLLLDGKRTYAWLLAYVPRAHREKMAHTVPEVSKVVYAYVRGQAMTSALFSVFAAVTLAFLDVPAILPLAILAGVCDVIPVVGIIIATVPAALLALTVSPAAAASVVGAYIVYHQFETYFIVPRVYGNTLRLSTLAVLLALIIGGTLQGILGAVLVLPLVAAYPIVERIWLADYMGREVIDDHKALAKAAATGSDAVIEAVLQGEQPLGDGLGDRVTAPAPARVTGGRV